MVITNQNRWSNLRVGITGASGTLGQALTKKLKAKGSIVIGLTSKKIDEKENFDNSPNEWINWECGNESSLDKTLDTLNILILNHGINVQGSQSNDDINKSLEINALSTWKLIERFEFIMNSKGNDSINREIWVNTSEAEIQPALSPAYEISKRLIGQLVTFKMKENNRNKKSNIIVRKIVLGPFKSKLNPIGIMNAEMVASQILQLVELRQNLIIVSPNPLTYLLMPLTELIRYVYFYLTEKLNIALKK
tara:strand:+ start:3152 stop:3901 length:750 start_codon:yes stop_codon:yes gene_type:complete